ncbi:hypothetical protein LOC67_22190 [Stieleria sp. JC731]|uniref:hypothetical protein n=1 Tax=Pirellulaceae TaxID=2691357 RepID=UPI001E5BC9D6|nr:hypothetical protein [Stieleria sp. JC731]MCC9603269.1 hypothetical protein [Stieleria sp. JC731]
MSLENTEQTRDVAQECGSDAVEVSRVSGLRTGLLSHIGLARPDQYIKINTSAAALNRASG